MGSIIPYIQLITRGPLFIAQMSFPGSSKVGILTHHQFDIKKGWVSRMDFQNPPGLFPIKNTMSQYKGSKQLLEKTSLVVKSGGFRLSKTYYDVFFTMNKNRDPKTHHQNGVIADPMPIQSFHKPKDFFRTQQIILILNMCFALEPRCLHVCLVDDMIETNKKRNKKNI